MEDKRNTSRIIQVCSGYPPDRIGGIENIVYTIHNYIPTVGYSSFVITRFWQREVNQRGVVQLETPSAELAGYLIWCAKSLTLIRRLRPKIIHCHGLEGALLCILLYPSRIKKVMHLHNSLSRERGFKAKLSHQLGLFILKIAMSCADIIVCPTSAAKNDLISNTSNKIGKKAVVIHNFCSEPNRVSDEEVQNTKKKLGIDDKKVILYFGKIKSTKGIEHLCRAYSLMLSKQDVSLVLAGATTATDKFFNKIKASYPDVILTGYVDNPALYYQMADIFCIYTDSFGGGETFALSLADAMIHKILVVASENSIYREVTNGYALFARPNRPSELARILDYAIKNKRELDHLAMKAQIHAGLYYNKSKFLNSIRLLYAWVLDAKK